MEFDELRKRTKEELQRTIQESREKLRMLRFDLASGKVKNVREIRKIKKNIARTLTLLHENCNTTKKQSNKK